MKKKIIIISVVLVALVGGFVLYTLNNWGEAKSEINELEITEVSEKIESDVGVEINDIGELKGTYISYDIDSSTSELMFKLGAIQTTVGKFKQFEVTFTGSETPNIEVTIDPNSIYTGESTRDGHLLGDGFFETSKFPTIQFESSRIELTDSNYVAYGELLMLGLKREISIPFSYLGKGENYKGLEVAIFEGSFEFNRTNYGMEHAASVSDDVSVTFKVQLEKQNE